MHTIKKLKWSSSNPDVAYVNQNGDVIADESGSAVITLQLQMEATCLRPAWYM